MQLLRIMPLPRIIRLLRCRICPFAAVLPLLAVAGAWATEAAILDNLPCGMGG